MKRKLTFTLFSLLLLNLISIQSSWAKIFNYEHSVESKKSLSEIKSRILEFSQMCADDCAYFYSSIKAVKVFPQANDNEWVVWYKASRGGHSYFTRVKVTEEKKKSEELAGTDDSEADVKEYGKVTIDTALVARNEAEKLEKVHGLNHNSFFHQMTSSWILEEKRDAEGHFLCTIVKHKSSSAKDGMLATLGGAKIQEAIREAAEEKMAIILRD